MSMTHGIILLGANGSGKSTLGRELAHVLNFTHFDKLLERFTSEKSS